MYHKPRSVNSGQERFSSANSINLEKYAFFTGKKLELPISQSMQT